jgi:hypothetical protein
MQSLFDIQSVEVDPHCIEYVADRIIRFCELGYGDGVTKFDFFLSYRKNADRNFVEKIYLQLKLRGAHPFLDSYCLHDGEEWKTGFLRALLNSRAFVAVISKNALEKLCRFDIDHRGDNLLLEYETALRIKNILGKQKYIVPLLVGEYVDVQGRNALFKFDNFNSDLYSPSLFPVPCIDNSSTTLIDVGIKRKSSFTDDCHASKKFVGEIDTAIGDKLEPQAGSSLRLDDAWALLIDPSKMPSHEEVGKMQALLADLGVESAEYLEFLDESDIHQIASLMKKAPAGKFLKIMNDITVLKVQDNETNMLI